MATLLSDEDFAEIEQAAYEAAVIPELWPKALGLLGKISNSVGGSFVCINERGTDIVCVPEIDGARRRIIEGGYMTRSGRAAGAISRGLIGTPRFVNEFDYYASLEDAETDPIVVEVFRQEGMGWAAGWVNQTPHGDMVIMNVEQYFERGPIVGDDLARLDAVYPVMARAVTLASRVGVERVRTAIDTMTAIGLPAAAVTPNLRVLFANDAFSAATHVWTTAYEDRLGLHDRVAAQMLSEAVAEVATIRGSRSIPIRREPGGAVTSIIQMVPIRRQVHDIFGSAAAILVLSERKAPGAEATLVQALFDLTPAEISIAQAIAAGLSVTQIAAATGRSAATVRNQLKSAMSKTGSRRQIELALLMRQLGSQG